MNKVITQQGDCLLIKAGEIPADAKRIKLEKESFVLLKGEGVNLHEIIGQFEVYELEGVLYLNVKKEVDLVHSEHGVEKILPGAYRREIEREWDYESEEARKTID